MSEKIEKVVKLKYSIPIPGKDDEIINTNELRIGRLKAKHMKLFPDNFMEGGGKMSPAELLPLIAGLANIPESSAGEIDIEDLAEVAEALQGFLGEHPETGKK